MNAKKGRNSIVAIATVKHVASDEETQVAFKWGIAKDEAIVYERNAIKYLSELPGIIGLFADGKLGCNIGKEVLVMSYFYCPRSALESFSSEGLVRFARAASAIIQNMHESGVAHLNVTTQSVWHNPLNGGVCVGSLQYLTLLDSANEDSKRRAAAAGIGKPPRNPPSTGLSWLDQQSPVDRDSFMLGSMLLSCMARNIDLFRSGGVHNLSKFGDGSDEVVSNLISAALSEFNLQIAEGDQKLQMREGIVAVIQGLLCKQGRLSCGEACVMIDGLNIPQQIRVDSRVVPAKYVQEIDEMQRSIEIFTTECRTREGKAVPGFGIKAYGPFRKRDLIQVYAGTSVDKRHADLLIASNLGHSLKNGGGVILMGGVVDGTILSLNWLAERGAASLANSNNIVTPVEDPIETVIAIQPIPANAYWDIMTLKNPRKYPIPGAPISDVVIVLRAARDGDHGEQFFVDYGNGTTRAMFVAPGNRFVVRKRAKASTSA